MNEIELPVLSDEKQGICRKIIDYYSTNQMGYIKVPTGWGKTFLAKHLMRKYYEEGKSILFLVSNNNQLLNQTFFNNETKTKLFSNSLLLSSENKQGRVSKEDLLSKIEDKSKGFVVFASLQTICSNKNAEIKDILCNNIDLVVIDEIHNFIGNRGNDLIDKIKKDTKIFGMTATPFQGVVGNVKFVDEISGDMGEIYNKSLPKCILEGQLSELSYKIIRNNQNISDLFDFKKGLSELSKQELYLDCSTLKKIDLIVQRTHLAKKVYYEALKTKNKKTLIFCAPVRNTIEGFGDDEKKINAFHAKLCSAIFNNELEDRFDPSISFNNYFEDGEFKNTVYLSSDLKKEERDKILEAFRNNDKPPFIVCSVGMLIEGFDFPDLENLILLRPTLSMRLFEQQVGRVIRLSKKSSKNRGNIFEIVDEIDSLFDTFGENVFGEKNLERLDMLEPLNRIEHLLEDKDDTIKTMDSNKIEITEINFNDLNQKFHEKSVQVPSINLRVVNLCDILKYEGVTDKKELFRHVIKFKLYNINDAREISKIIKLLDKLEETAFEDIQLKKNIKSNKTKLKQFKEVKWLLKLQVLTYLRYYCNNLDENEKNRILKILGFESDYSKIDNYREECLKSGVNINIKHLIKAINSINRDKNKPLKLGGKELGLSKLIMGKEHLSLIYFAYCFRKENEEINTLFESKDGNTKLKNMFREI
ncbi:MAG: DEAD/DEAH box helicase [Spirochaetes bacterium]|nr:DEAD/DEAH box helicase [Spirochaetota bacterium]